MMSTRSRVFLFVGLMLLLTACVQPTTGPAGLQIVDAWARPAQQMTDAPAAKEAMTITTSSGAMTGTQATTGTMAITGTMATTGTLPMTRSTGGMGMGMGGANSAAYMTIRNPGNQPDRLVKATSDVAKVVELHTVEEQNGVMSMHPVEGIDVPANGEATLKPGGFHVMLIALTRDLKVGDTVTVTLTFANAGDMTVQAKVRER